MSSGRKLLLFVNTTGLVYWKSLIEKVERRLGAGVFRLIIWQANFVLPPNEHPKCQIIAAGFADGKPAGRKIWVSRLSSATSSTRFPRGSHKSLLIRLNGERQTNNFGHFLNCAWSKKKSLQERQKKRKKTLFQKIISKNPKVIFLCLVHNKLRAKLSQLTAAAAAVEFLCGNNYSEPHFPYLQLSVWFQLRSDWAE